MKTPSAEDLMKHLQGAKARGEDYGDLLDENPFMPNFEELFGGAFDPGAGTFKTKPDCDACSIWRGVYSKCPKCGK